MEGLDLYLETDDGGRRCGEVNEEEGEGVDVEMAEVEGEEEEEEAEEC